MRRIINSTYVSLDGDQGKLDEWHFEHWSDEVAAYAQDLLFSSDALLMGRLTYEGFAPAWSSRAGQDDFADRMNAIDKYVVSSTLEKAEWNNTKILSRENAVEEISKLKQQPGRNILMYGFGPVAKMLLEHDLLEEVRFWVHPVLAGAGSFNRDGFTTRFTLTDTKPFDTGVVVLTYEPKASG
jgi:dihydrofolate reductase